MEDMAASSGNLGLNFKDEDHWKTTTDSFDNDNTDNVATKSYVERSFEPFGEIRTSLVASETNK